MKAICEKCKKKHDGFREALRPLCLSCFGKAKGLKDQWAIHTAYCRTGRPKGTTKIPGEPTENDTHRMTLAAHAYIRKNKELIEDLARKPHHIQWKMF